jgi:hypothetical protein
MERLLSILAGNQHKHNKKAYKERRVRSRVFVAGLRFPYSGLEFSFCIRSPNTEAELPPGRISALKHVS